MSTVPNIPQPSTDPGDGHPAWCSHRDHGTEMHRGRSILVRDRDAVTVELYLVADPATTMVDVEVTAETDTPLVEFSLTEAATMNEALAALLAEAVNRSAA